jgi:hypothetical protein
MALIPKDFHLFLCPPGVRLLMRASSAKSNTLNKNSQQKVLAVAHEFGFDPEEIRALPNLNFVSRTDVGAELRRKIKV